MLGIVKRERGSLINGNCDSVSGGIWTVTGVYCFCFNFHMALIIVLVYADFSGTRKCWHQCKP